MRLKIGSIVERFRGSLFLVPMMAVLGAIALAALAIAIDSRLDRAASHLPLGFSSTVDSARALLGTVAGATITFAGIAFSISLLTIQQASSQYSPRVVHTLFRDPFNRRVMALVVGTFTYCLLILRSVRSSLEEGGAPVIPNLSVAVAVVLGILTILAIVAFIDHSAHSLDISRILEDVQHESLAQIRREWPEAERGVERAPRPDRPRHPAHTVRFDRNGWIQQLDVEKLAGCVPVGQTIWVDAYPGRYAVRGAPVCGLSHVPDDADEVERKVRSAVSIGETRTMQQDVAFGLRQLVDVALKSLSPGINDPTTAQDAILHVATVLSELLRRDPPTLEVGGDDVGRLVLVAEPTDDDLVGLAFDEVRRAAAPLPAVCLYLLDALDLVAEAMVAEGRSGTVPSLERQARLVVEACAAADNLPVDVQTVEAVYAERRVHASALGGRGG